MFAEVHSDTSARSFSRIASAKPARWAFSNSVRFCTHESVLVPANGDAAWRPFSCKSRDTVAGGDHQVRRERDHVSGSAGSRSFKHPSLTAHHIESHLAFGTAVSAHQADQLFPQVIPASRHLYVEQRGVALQPFPMPLVCEWYPLIYPQCRENSPSGEQADLAGA